MGVRKHIRRKIVTFVLLTFAISSIFYYHGLTTGSMRGPGGPAWMWSPGIAAILTQLLFRGKVREFGWRLGEAKYLLWGYALPWLYGLAIYGTVWVTGLGGFAAHSIRIGSFRLPVAVSLLAETTLLLIPACVAALGEEIGWRGLLVPELSKVTTFTKTAVLTGIIWAVWHYPAILFADYHGEAPLWYQLPIFTISVLGMSFVVAWLRLKTGSIWPAVLWHGNHNVLIQGTFLRLTMETGITEFLVDDFGIGLTLSMLVLAFIFWRKRSELPDTSVQEVKVVSTVAREQ